MNAPGEPFAANTVARCAECHQTQYYDWTGALHAQTVSSGVLVQLLGFSPERIQSCLRCHAPHPAAASDLTNRLAFGDDDITVGDDHSVSCPACHLRHDRVIGPYGNANRSEGWPLDHGVVGASEFKDSRFCARCHQNSEGTSASGVPLTNTYAEWRESPFSTQGIECQNCHLPDGRHLFRGIHDPETTRSGVTVQAVDNGASVTLSLGSTAVGHKFPTYAVPRVRMQLSLWRNNSGKSVRIAFREHVIGRKVRLVDGEWIELSDTRLSPGKSAQLELDWQPGAHYAHYMILVEPDAFYLETLYESNAVNSEDPFAQRLWRSARDRARENAYVLFEGRLTR